jgi:hypothetical protein
MASLKEATTTITDNLESLLGDLRSEFENGELDFDRLTSLSDEISEAADGLAETFSSINDTLMQRLDQIKSGSSGGSSRSGNSRSQKKTTAASS